MCCGHGMGMYPNSLGILISELKRGDEVIITKGEGYPPVPEETRDLILQVAGFSALTAGGVTLTCDTISQLVATGNNFEITKITPEARVFLELAVQRGSEEAQLILEEMKFDADAYLKGDPDPLDLL